MDGSVAARGLQGRKGQKGFKGEGHPIMFGFKEAEHFGPFPDGGGYPKGFLRHAYTTIGAKNPAHVLHLCSGSMKMGIRVDRRHRLGPSVVADVLALPFGNETFTRIMCDPPYAESYAETLYGLGKHYPRPGSMLREACRVLRPGGRIGFLHFVVPKWSGIPLKLIGVWGITQGTGFAIRAWSVFQKAAC